MFELEYPVQFIAAWAYRAAQDSAKRVNAAADDNAENLARAIAELGNKLAREQQVVVALLSEGRDVPCPYCAQLISRDALVCSECQGLLGEWSWASIRAVVMADPTLVLRDPETVQRLRATLVTIEAQVAEAVRGRRRVGAAVRVRLLEPSLGSSWTAEFVPPDLGADVTFRVPPNLPRRAAQFDSLHAGVELDAVVSEVVELSPQRPLAISVWAGPPVDAPAVVAQLKAMGIEPAARIRVPADPDERWSNHQLTSVRTVAAWPGRTQIRLIWTAELADWLNTTRATSISARVTRLDTSDPGVVIVECLAQHKEDRRIVELSQTADEGATSVARFSVFLKSLGDGQHAEAYAVRAVRMVLDNSLLEALHIVRTLPSVVLSGLDSQQVETFTTAMEGSSAAFDLIRES